MRTKLAAIVAAVSITLPASATAEDVRIGVIQALSGAPVIVDFGESYLQGVQAALEDYKAAKPKHSVTLTVYNDESNPQRAVSLAQRLITNDRVTVAIGTVNAANVYAIAPIFQQARVPLIVGPATATDITARFIQERPSFIFRCSMVEKYMTDALLDYVVKRYKKIGLLHTTSGYGMFAMGEIKRGMEARKAQLVAIESGGPTVSDLTPQVLKLKNAGVDFLLAYHDAFELTFRALQKADFHPAIGSSWGLSSTVTGRTVGKDAIERAVMAQALDVNAPRAKVLNESMTRRYGEKYRWPIVAALGYDTMQIALAAIDRAGTDPEKVRSAIESIDGLNPVSGMPAKPYSATDHECIDAEQVFMGVWRGGRVVRLDE